MTHALTIESTRDPERMRAAGITPRAGLSLYRITGNALSVQREIERLMDKDSTLHGEFAIPRRLDRAGTRWRAAGYIIRGDES